MGAKLDLFMIEPSTGSVNKAKATTLEAACNNGRTQVTAQDLY